MSRIGNWVKLGDKKWRNYYRKKDLRIIKTPSPYRSAFNLYRLEVNGRKASDDKRLPTIKKEAITYMRKYP